MFSDIFFNDFITCKITISLRNPRKCFYKITINDESNLETIFQDIVWIINNKEDYYIVQIHVTPASQAYVYDQNKLTNYPRFIPMIGSDIVNDCRMRCDMLASAIKKIMILHANIEKDINIQIYMKIVSKIIFEDNKIKSDTFDYKLLHQLII
jgi:hypothetical protein